jgi:hypothetical protein
MITVVMLLMLPAVLGMSAFRLVQLPRDLWARRTRINPSRKWLCAFALGVVYCALATQTTLVLIAVARALWAPPKTVQDLFAAAIVAVGYPLVYLAFEWVLYYTVKPVPQA